METIKKFIRSSVFKFIIVGSICAGIEFLSFNILVDTFKVAYLSANVISICIAISINYILSRAFVFQKSKYSKRKEFLSFVFFSVLALLLNQFILWMLVEVVRFNLRLCKAMAIFLVAFFNYLTKKHIVFKS